MTHATSRLSCSLVALCLSGLLACGGGGNANPSTALGTGSGSPTGTGTGTGIGTGTANGAYTLPPTLTGHVKTAVTTGNALVCATADELIDATLATIDYQRTAFDAVITQLYNLNSNGTAKTDGTSLTALSWDPRHDTALLSATFGVNTEVIVTNETTAGVAAGAKGLAIAGQTASKSRYLVMGTNPFRTDVNRNNASVVNAQMDQFMVNGIQWLTGKAKGEALKVAILQMDESTWFADESATRTWLTAKLGANVTFNTAGLYDGANSGNILRDGADLVIVSQAYDAAKEDPKQITAGLKALMDAGKPVLYVNLDGGPNALGTQLYNLFQVQYSGDNYWSHLRATGLNGGSLLGRLGTDMVSIREMLTRLKSGTYDFTLANHTSTPELSAVYATQFQNGANAVRGMVGSYDASRVDIFKTDGKEVAKLLTLIGDRLRQDIVYPMSADKTSPREFLRAYYADHSVYNFRAINPAQKDLGTFSTKDLSKVTPISKTVSMTSCVPFKAAGVYALPGKPMKVSRLDAGSVTVRVSINSIRSGSTHEWDPNGYTRPKYLWSNAITLNPGEAVTLTNPYGGPVQVSFSTNDVPVELQFENVGQHAYWGSAADDDSFAQALATAEFDWAELSAGAFVIHSKLDRFKNTTMRGTLWSTPQTVATATMQYAHNHTHVLAGFRGEGIVEVPEVHGWAASKGFTVATFSSMQHMNADQATCGGGCSGNPYDTWGAFQVIEHGNLHEIGHGLQSGRMLFSTGTVQQGGHGATNFYSTYARQLFYENTGLHDAGDGSRGGIGLMSTPSATPDALFKALVGCASSPDPGAAMELVMQNALSGATPDPNDHNFDPDAATTASLATQSYDYNYTVFYQMQMQAVKRGKLAIGHHLIPRLHILERNYNAALKDAATWDAAKASLGFGTLSYDQAKALPTNDWLVIATSWAVGLDFRNLLDMMGCRFGATASAQVAAFNFASTGKEYMLANNGSAANFKNSRAFTEYGSAIQIKTVIISPTATWPW